MDHKKARSTDSGSGALPAGRTARFSLVGVGPGDPELLTLKAASRIAQADCLIAPKGRTNGASSALSIAAGAVDISGKEILEAHFPMKHVRLGGEKDQDVVRAWKDASSQVLSRLQRGMNVVFPTLGDPSIYSTAFYLLAVVQEQAADSGMELRAEMIPGITAMSSCSCGVLSPLALGDDILSVIPAAFEDERLEQILLQHDSIVLMKVHNSMDRLVPLLERTGLKEKAVLVERCGMADQRIFHDIEEAASRRLHYFSTILVRRRGLDCVTSWQQGPCHEG